jgi:hypothetical protein
MELWEPKLPGTPWATPGLLWDSSSHLTGHDNYRHSKNILKHIKVLNILTFIIPLLGININIKIKNKQDNLFLKIKLIYMF